jgi:hypothetical protein
LPHRTVLSVAVAAAAVFAPATAQAKPVTVNLRVEGPTKTVFEGRVTTGVRTFHFTNESTTHQCSGSGVVAAPVRNGALVTAAEQRGFALTGTWGDFGPTFDHVGDQAVSYDDATGRYLVEYKNGRASDLGGCSDPIVDGDDVVYAYASMTDPMLRLVAPRKAVPGHSITVRVTTTKGRAVGGAKVGGATTRKDGRAVIDVAKASGPLALKAEKPGTVRSNAATICVTDGQPGADCPQIDFTAPTARVGSIRDGARFAHGHGPRRLAGTARDGSGIRDVRLRVTRGSGRRCRTYDAAKKRVVRCGAGQGRWFSAGATRNWHYVLPERLGRGRWALDVRVADWAGNAGRTRVVFTVR